jgi:hypothetical protein
MNRLNWWNRWGIGYNYVGNFNGNLDNFSDERSHEKNSVLSDIINERSLKIFRGKLNIELVQYQIKKTDKNPNEN